MAELVTIARPYAEAIFRLAKDKNALPAWSDRLAHLTTLAQHPEMQACIGNPSLGIAQKADLVKALCGDAVEGDLANLIDALAENERLSVIPEIAGVFEGLKAVEDGVKDAVIHTAFPIDNAQQQKLQADLEARFATKLKVSVVVDAGLIGGVRIVVGDQVLDLSVRGKLDALAAALKN